MNGASANNDGGRRAASLVSRRTILSGRLVRCIAGWLVAIAVVAGADQVVPALAAECGADALGASRIITVDPTEHPLVGTMQYSETLPLADHEIVISFDDGPSPRYTDRILEILAAQCVKAAFFMVGGMAQTFSAEARKVESEGHTIGTHSIHHPFAFGRMSGAEAGEEIDKGIDAIGRALGNPADLAPFFRVPGFLTSKTTEAVLAARGTHDVERGYPGRRLEGN